MRPLLAFAFALGLLLPPTAAWAGRPAPCDEAILFPGGVCTTNAGAAVATCCPCDDFRNHGRYVRCVAHATNALRKAGCLDFDARRSLKRCAARSTCSKPGFVTCCSERPGRCKEGFCEQSDPALPPIACTTDDVCPPRPKCTLKRDAQLCLDQGGVPGSGSCCGGTSDKDGACFGVAPPPPIP